MTERIALEEELRPSAAELEERVRERTAELEAERARLAAVVDRMPAGLVILGADGKVVTANRETRRLFGDDLDAIAAMCAGGSGRGEFVRADGSTVPVDIRVAPIADETGADRLYVVYDATARERKDRAKREFVTNAAHQLQSPLAGILSAVEVLQFGAKDGPERDVFLAHIEREARRLARLIRALLILARAQTGYEAPKDEIVAVAPMLEETAAALRLQEGVTVEISCNPSLAVVTNRELVEQALANVAENAAKYTAAGRITIDARSHDGRVQIAVTDTGPGIPEEDRERVLEQFYRAAPSGAEGFGLGFAIVRAAVEAVDGKLAVESEVDVGTTVRIDLPRPASMVRP